MEEYDDNDDYEDYDNDDNVNGNVGDDNGKRWRW